MHTVPYRNFSGLWIPLVTPFDHAGAIDHAALRRLVAHLAPTGIAGFVVCGSTGEAAALDGDEQLAVLDTVLDCETGLPVLMGLAGNHRPSLLRQLQRCVERPVAGLLVPPPYYVRPSQRGLIEHFIELADASPVPLVLYDIPYRTGVPIDLDSFHELARHPAIQAVKDCGGSPEKTQALIAAGKLQVLAGEDAQVFGTLCQGGHGAIAAAAHLHTGRFVAMCQAIAQGRLAEARVAHRALAPVIRLLFAEPNPAPLKAVLARQGLIGDHLRPPMTAAAPELVARLAALC